MLPSVVLFGPIGNASVGTSMVFEGQSASFRCLGDGHPTTSIRWFLNVCLSLSP